VLCALLFGIAPAWMASRTAPALRFAARGTAHIEKNRLRQSFVCVQMAFSLTLVVVAALLSVTLMRLRDGHNGFRANNVLFASTDFSHLPQKGTALAQLYRQLSTRMEEIPGVDAASDTLITPAGGSYHNADFSALHEKAGAVGAVRQNAAFNEIGTHYFSAMGIRMLAGRDFFNRDANANTCILNRAAAANLFPLGPAIGSAIRQYQPNMNTGQTAVYDCEVIGIVEDAKYRDLRTPAPPTIYYPVGADSEGLGSLTLVIHAQSLSEAKLAYQKALHELAPGTPEAEPIPFVEQIDNSIAGERLLATLSGFFAALALLLSALGIYGLIAWSVTQRTTEIGVRMALGASRVRVFLLVLRQIAGLLLIGVAFGAIAAFFTARSIRSFLFEVQPGSPAVFVLAALALIMIGLLAATLPARRAISIDPMEALRAE
jgi:predicted permease